MEPILYITLVTITLGAASFFVRALPFYALRRYMHHPSFEYLGKCMPAAIMMLLVIFSFTDAQFLEAPYGANDLIAGLLVIIIYLVTGNNLLTIAVSTGVYMYLKQSEVLMAFLT